MKKIVVLGSTGSIGVNTLKVVEDHPDCFEVVGLSARNNVERLRGQIRAFRPKKVAMADAAGAEHLKRLLGSDAPEIGVGEEGVEALAGMEGADFVVVAITGAAALKPALRAIMKGRVIGLANKETMVMAGELMIEEAKRSGSRILPIDSEHSAIFQCLQGHAKEDVRRILLTSSGGPLRDVPAQRFAQMTKAEVLNHPRWKMGPKITVDSATMMNKGLEVIEARWLFGIPVAAIEVIIHPEAIVHSMVEFIDGSILAQLGVADMRLPIQYALTFPKRLPSSVPALDLVGLKQLTFEAVDPKFPCVGFGYEAARAGGTAPAVLNAANEAAVAAFLSDRLDFPRIPQVIERVMSKHRGIENPNLVQILDADRWAHEEVRILLNGGGR